MCSRARRARVHAHTHTHTHRHRQTHNNRPPTYPTPTHPHTHTHTVSALAANIVCTPFDVIKSRIQNMPAPAPGQKPIYTGMVDCAVKGACACSVCACVCACVYMAPAPGQRQDGMNRAFSHSLTHLRNANLHPPIHLHTQPPAHTPPHIHTHTGVKAEGMGVLYRGFTPSFIKLAPCKPTSQPPTHPYTNSTYTRESAAHELTHAHMRVRIHTGIHARTHTHTHARTHAHTHTPTHTRVLPTQTNTTSL